MEVAGFVLNIVGVARGIHSHLDELKSRKEKFKQLQWRVMTLIEVLLPLTTAFGASSSTHQSGKVTDLVMIYDSAAGTQDFFIELAEILSNIRQRVSVYRAKFRFGKIMDFVNPSVLLGRLEDDENRLSRWIELFMLKLQIAQHASTLAVQQSNQVLRIATNSPGPVPQRMAASPAKAPEETSTSDARMFWNTCLGEEEDAVAPNLFFPALKGWIRQPLEDWLCASLLLALDSEELGVIARKNLIRVAGKQTITDYVSQLRNWKGTQLAGTWLKSQDYEIKNDLEDEELKPTIVWIDDRQEMVEADIDFAESLGITVFLLPSTSTAKLWIEAHEEYLRRLEAAFLLQFVTDNSRWEPGRATSDIVLNMAAGESILRFLRGNRFMSPVLVYCGRSINETQYVKNYSNAASTSYPSMCQEFISYLKVDENGVGRAGYPARWTVFAAERSPGSVDLAPVSPPRQKTRSRRIQ